MRALISFFRDRVILAGISISCAIIVALLPFFLERIIAGRAIRNTLNIAAHNPSAPDAFRANVLFALVLLMPTVAFWFWRKPSINYTEFWLIAGLCTSIAITVVIGGISGPYHLLPFVPLCLYTAIIMADAPARAPVASQAIAFIFILLLLAYVPGGFIVK